MIVSKSLFPVSRGFSTIADMQSRMDKLQVQLATGERAATLSELGTERVYDLAIRARQGRIDAYEKNIKTVNLRLDFLNNAVSRMDELESDARASASTGGAGSDNTGIVTAQSLATARLDEMLALLRSDVNGRYLFGGGITDVPPVQTLSTILDGVNGRDGFRTIVGERKLADMGADGRGRVVLNSTQLTSSLPAADTVRLTEDNAVANPLRLQITGVSTSNPAEITLTGPAGTPVSIDMQFGAAVAPGDTVTVNITTPDGVVVPRTLTASAGPTPNAGEFVIGATPADTATNFRAALDAVMLADTVTLAEDGAHPFGLKLSTVSTSSAAIATSITPTTATAGVNSFVYAADATAYGVGDTTTFDISVDGGAPVAVTINQAIVSGVGNFDNVIDDITEMQAVLTAALTAAGVTGVTVGNDGTNITLTSNTPGATSNVTISNFLGDGDAGGNANTGGGLVDGAGTTGIAGGAPSWLTVRFTGTPLNGEKVSVGVTMPDGRSHTIEFTATASAPNVARQFQIGATPDATRANFEAALNTELLRLGSAELEAASVYASADNFFAGQGGSVMRVSGPPFETATTMVAATSTDTVFWYQGEDSAGLARQTVQARVDDGTVVSYGVQANETGIVGLVRALAAMAVEDYPSSDPNSAARYNAMNLKQIERLSEGNNAQPGSLEVITLELGVAYSTNGQAKERHTAYKAQLENLLADIEQISNEEVAVTLLSLQTRLEASYQTTAMIANLTLVNYIS